MQFGAVADIYMAKKKDEILIACNINQLDIYNIIIDYLHKKHINNSCISSSKSWFHIWYI